MSDETLCGESLLRDGTRVRIRPIEPRDARTLQAAFRELSPESRRRRFRRPKPRLSRREVRTLTECDGVRHLALGAVRLDADGWECEGLGVARYVCLPGHPEVAEPAITVIDAAQGLGLGRLLAERLGAAASARGVKTFRTLLLDEHGWLRERIARAYPGARLTRRGPVLGADIPLQVFGPSRPDAAPVRGPEPHWSLLRWVAQGIARPGRPGRLREWIERLSPRRRRDPSRDAVERDAAA
ncbi:MAG: hypothetical protein HKP30_13295 [Myxococcales bacterium]|nr:hypothetical protein [Myxococcales bacterium]